MTMTASITAKWQLHIPQDLRKKAGLDKPGMVTITAMDGKLIISPRKSKILTLGGSLNKIYKEHPVNLDRIRDEIDYS